MFALLQVMALPRINVGNITDVKTTKRFISMLELIVPSYTSESAEKRWSSLSTTIYNSAVTAYGKKEGKNAEWYEVDLTVMELLTAAKRTPLSTNRALLPQMLSELRPQTARKFANEYWLQLCSIFQMASDTGNVRDLYRGHQISHRPSYSEDSTTHDQRSHNR